MHRKTFDQLYSPTSVVDSKQGDRKKEKDINSLHSSTKNHNLQQYLQNTLSTLLNCVSNVCCLLSIVYYQVYGE